MTATLTIGQALPGRAIERRAPDLADEARRLNEGSNASGPITDPAILAAVASVVAR